MRIHVPNTSITLKVNHPVLVAPAPTQPLPRPKLMVERKKKA